MSSPPLPSLSALLAGGPRVMGILNVTPDSFSDGGR
ncbi:dihydropteroate synthase, partial [Acidobacteria bacterium ACD]|nr:dihydropteroate synthase [Acidobacteria bacterium ACD]